ncbi:hypothetical protein ACHAQD_001942 [Fusarium lateritium]
MSNPQSHSLRCRTQFHRNSQVLSGQHPGYGPHGANTSFVLVRNANADEPKCLARGLSCVFSTNIDHRGSAPRSHVSLLQARIALLEQVLQLHEIDIDASIARITAQKHESEAGLPSPDVECQKDSQDVSQRRDRDEPFLGATSGRLELPTKPNITLPSNNSNPHISRPKDKIPPNQLQGLFPPDNQPLALCSNTSAELEENLIHLFFEWEQPWLQVIDETLFKDSLRSNGRYHSALLLDCMMALASRYSDRPDVRSDPRDSNTAGMTFMQSAEVRLQAELKWPTITTVQSLAIMAIFYVVRTRSDAAGWLHHGMAIRLVLDMGFNLDTTADVGLDRLTIAEVQLRRQIYWALYCTDKLWASYTGRVCTMLLTNWLAGLTRLRALNGKLLNQQQPERFCGNEWI